MISRIKECRYIQPALWILTKIVDKKWIYIDGKRERRWHSNPCNLCHSRKTQAQCVFQSSSMNGKTKESHVQRPADEGHLLSISEVNGAKTSKMRWNIKMKNPVQDLQVLYHRRINCTCANLLLEYPNVLVYLLFLETKFISSVSTNPRWCIYTKKKMDRLLSYK